MTCSVVALLLVLAVPSTGSPQAPLPVGEAKGVRIVRERGALVVVFTQRAEKLRRRVAGKPVSVLCTEFIPHGRTSGGATQRAAKRGRRIRTGDLTRGMDYCRIWIAARTVRRDGERRRLRRKLVVSIPLTQAGAVYLDEELKADTIVGLLSLAGLLGEDRDLGGYPTPAELLEAVPGLRPRPWRRPVVALAAATDTPAADTVGYYSDGERHAAAVIVSAGGRRLFVEYEGDVLHTNVATYMFGGRD